MFQQQHWLDVNARDERDANKLRIARESSDGGSTARSARASSRGRTRKKGREGEPSGQRIETITMIHVHMFLFFQIFIASLSFRHRSSPYISCPSDTSVGHPIILPVFPCHGDESWLGHFKVCFPVLLRPQEYALKRDNQRRSLHHKAAVVHGFVCAKRLF